MSPVEILQKKFQSIGLADEDREPLLQYIRGEADPLTLASLLYIWGYEFGEHKEVKALCVKHIDQPTPCLTSVCLKLVCDWWGCWREHEEQLAKYLNPDIYDDWYDEVIVAYSLVSRQPYGWSRSTLERYERVDQAKDRLELPNFD